VLTGGGAQLPGIVDLAKKELRLPVQIGISQNISTVIDRLDEPSFCTAVGLVLWGIEYARPSSHVFKKLTSSLPIPKELTNKIRSWFKSFLP